MTQDGVPTNGSEQSSNKPESTEISSPTQPEIQSGGSRRRFLKALGITAGAAALPTSAVAAAKPSTQSGSDTFTLLGTQDKPITAKQISRVQKKAKRQLKQHGGTLKSPVVSAVPEVNDANAKVVAYVYKIDSQGTVYASTSFASNDVSVGDLHTKAKNTASKYDSMAAQVASTDSLSTQSGSMQWGNPYRIDSTYFKKKPYGVLTNNFNLWKLQNDGNSSRDYWSIKHIYDTEPGAEKWGNSWQSRVGKMWSDWSVSSNWGGNPSLHDWDPQNDVTGSMSVTVTLSADGSPTEGWTYTQPAITRKVHTDQSASLAKWEEDFNNNTVRTTTEGMKPGSLTSDWQPPSGFGQVKLLDLVSQCKYHNAVFLGNDYTMKDTFHIYVTY